MTEAEQKYFETGKSLAEAIQSQMFGKPCFKANGKAFICFFQDCMVFKLGGHYHKEALCLDGSKLFDPSGKDRPMKEWVQDPFQYHPMWPGLAKAALEFILNVNS